MSFTKIFLCLYMYMTSKLPEILLKFKKDSERISIHLQMTLFSIWYLFSIVSLTFHNSIINWLPFAHLFLTHLNITTNHYSNNSFPSLYNLRTKSTVHPTQRDIIRSLLFLTYFPKFEQSSGTPSGTIVTGNKRQKKLVIRKFHQEIIILIH